MGFGEDLEKILSKLDSQRRASCNMIAGVIRGVAINVREAARLYGEAVTSPEISDAERQHLILQADMVLPDRGDILWLLDTIKDTVKPDVIDKLIPTEWVDELVNDVERIRELINRRVIPSEVYSESIKVSSKWLIRYCDVHRRCAEMMSQGGGSNG